MKNMVSAGEEEPTHTQKNLSQCTESVHNKYGSHQRNSLEEEQKKHK